MHPDQSYSDLLFIGMRRQQMTSESLQQDCIYWF